MNAVLTVVMIYCSTPAVVGVTLYATHFPAWRRSRQGRNFMLLTASIGAIALTVLVMQIFDVWRYYQYILAVLFTVVGSLLWQRLSLIVEQIQENRRKDEQVS